jgi:hypothetical protein
MNGKAGELLPAGSGPTTPLSDVQARSNFNETAFFYPQLQTNENGEQLSIL